MAAPLLLKVAGSLLAMGVLAACQKVLADAKMRPLATLAGSEWGFGSDDSGGERFVGFKANGEVVGSGGCNNFFGSFTQDGRTLTFGPLASTKKACPGELMQQERDFLDLLGRVRAVEATHAELVLFGDGDAELARLRRRDWD